MTRDRNYTQTKSAFFHTDGTIPSVGLNPPATVPASLPATPSVPPAPSGYIPPATTMPVDPTMQNPNMNPYGFGYYNPYQNPNGYPQYQNNPRRNNQNGYRNQQSVATPPTVDTPSATAKASLSSITQNKPALMIIGGLVLGVSSYFLAKHYNQNGVVLGIAGAAVGAFGLGMLAKPPVAPAV